jgi:hypothetical protein
MIAGALIFLLCAKTQTMFGIKTFLCCKNDGAMLKGPSERRQLCKEWIECPSPTSSPCQSDDEEDGAQTNASHRNDVVLGMAGWEVAEM